MSLLAGLRRWHTWGASLGWGLSVFLATTGILINHPETFGADRRDPEQWRATLAPELLAGDDLQLVEELRASGPVYGRLQDIRRDDLFIELRFAGPGGSTDISIDRELAEADAYVERAGTVAWLGHLHRGKDASLTWRLLLDAAAVLVLAAAVTGLWMVWQLPKRRAWGLGLAGLGVVVPVLLVLLA